MEAVAKLNLIKRNLGAGNLEDLRKLAEETQGIPWLHLEALVAFCAAQRGGLDADSALTLGVDIEAVSVWMRREQPGYIDPEIFNDLFAMADEPFTWEPENDVQRDLIEEAVAIVMQRAYPAMVVDMRKTRTQKVYTALVVADLLDASRVAATFQLVAGADPLQFDIRFYAADGTELGG